MQRGITGKIPGKKLQIKRRHADAGFIYTIVNNLLVSLALFAIINFHVPRVASRIRDVLSSEYKCIEILAFL